MSQNSCQNQDGWNGLDKNFCQTDFPLELLFLLHCSPHRVGPEEFDQPGGPVLWVEVERGPQDCSQSVFLQPGPGQPGQDVVQQEGNQQGRGELGVTPVARRNTETGCEISVPFSTYRTVLIDKLLWYVEVKVGNCFKFGEDVCGGKPDAEKDERN